MTFPPDLMCFLFKRLLDDMQQILVSCLPLEHLALKAGAMIASKAPHHSNGSVSRTCRFCCDVGIPACSTIRGCAAIVCTETAIKFEFPAPLPHNYTSMQRLELQTLSNTIDLNSNARIHQSGSNFSLKLPSSSQDLHLQEHSQL